MRLIKLYELIQSIFVSFLEALQNILETPGRGQENEFEVNVWLRLKQMKL